MFHIFSYIRHVSEVSYFKDVFGSKSNGFKKQRSSDEGLKDVIFKSLDPNFNLLNSLSIILILIF